MAKSCAMFIINVDIYTKLHCVVMEIGYKSVLLKLVGPPHRKYNWQDLIRMSMTMHLNLHSEPEDQSNMKRHLNNK